MTLHSCGSTEYYEPGTPMVTLEAIIRLLVDDFGVPANEPDDVWRPLLLETEEAFVKIARQPVPR